MQRPEIEVIRLDASILVTASCPDFCTKDCSAVCGAGDCEAECVGYCKTDCVWD